MMDVSEILKVIGLLMIAVPVSIILALIVVFIPLIIWELILEAFYHIKEKT